MSPSLVLSLSLAVLISFEAGMAAVSTASTPDSNATSGVQGPAATSTWPRLPACGFSAKTTPLNGYDDWALTLLDTSYSLPAGYQPPDLVNTRRAGLNGGYMVRSVPSRI